MKIEMDRLTGLKIKHSKVSLNKERIKEVEGLGGSG